MVISQNQLGVTLTARDQITETLRRVEGHVSRLDRAFGSLGGRLKTGLQMHVFLNAMNLVDRAVMHLVGIIPGLIDRGSALARTVNDLTDATGMNARQASELIAVQKAVGGSSEGLATAFKALSKSVTEHTDDWKAMGVEIARNRDGSVNAYRTFRNLQSAIAATGAGTLSFAAAQKLAGRGASDLLDLLQLAPRDYRALAREAQRSGQIMTDAQNAAAEAFERAQSNFRGVLDGIGSQIYQGLLPAFTSLTNGFGDFLTRNMDQIVSFVVNAGNAVLNVVGGLLGIDFGEFTLGDALDRTKKKSDDARKAIHEVGQEHRRAGSAALEHARDTDLLAASQRRLRDALRELRAAREGMPFGGDVSDADYILARQRRAARIEAAQQEVRDARKALHSGAGGVTGGGVLTGGPRSPWSGLHGSGRGDGPGGKGGGGPVGASVIEGLKESLADSRAFGRGIASTIKDLIFGPIITNEGSNVGQGADGARMGGLLSGLQSIAESISSAAAQWQAVADLVKRIWDFLNPDFSQDPFKQDWTKDIPWLNTGTKTPVEVQNGAVMVTWDPTKTPINGGGYAGYRGWRTDGPDAPRGNYAVPTFIPGITPPGFGLDPSQVGVRAIADAMDESRLGNAFDTSGAFTTTMANIVQALTDVADKIENLNTGGGGGTGALVDRVAYLEGQMTGARDSALKTANQRQDDMLGGRKPSNLNEYRKEGDRRLGRYKLDKSTFQGFRDNWSELLFTGDSSHSARLTDLERKVFGSDRGREAGAAGRTVVNVFLDSRRIGRAMAPSGRTTSLRPG